MARRRGQDIDGWLVLDKPLELGSTTAVAIARRLYDARKVGHAGTLDPLATGVLPIAFGKATKTIPWIMDATKEYRFTLVFGESRTTDDREGEVLALSEVRPSDTAILGVLPMLTGDVMQVPPVYSALKVGGQRAYDLARAGKPPELPPRPARIDSITLVERPDRDHAVFDVRSGKGVYMRSLARDIALACGTVGHIGVLRRTKCGPFTEMEAISLDNLRQSMENADALPVPLRPVATVLDDIPALAVTEEEAKALLYGQSLDLGVLAGRLPAMEAGVPLRAICGERVIGLCRTEDGRLRPSRMF